MAQPQPTLLSRIANNGDVALAAGVLGLLMIMLVPLPTFLLDGLLAASVSVSLLLFLVALFSRRAVDFSTFPTFLLVATVFRLALNVASTRRILLEGHTGPDAAGTVIQAFGQFVVGGNFVVGMVVFAILVVINFVVITKGAGRIAEVAARFTLDAMPGKQMAVDAELNAGLIGEDQARTRREDIAREADFYGAMDGASKFVRGDAIAGIIITLVNIVGGAFIGVVQNDMTLLDAAQNYTILTIGDGLVGQVPALIISTAAGMLVTRVDDSAKGDDLASKIGSQLLASPRTLAITAAALAVFALIPGLRVPFLGAAVVVGWLAWTLRGRKPVSETAAEEVPTTPGTANPEDLLSLEALSIEVGVDLLYLVDERQGGELLQRIQRTRNQFAQDLGIVLPPVVIRDNLRNAPGQYVLMLRGEELGRSVLHARKHLALDAGDVQGKLKGVATTDPVFGLPSVWINDSQILRAQSMGYTVVDVPTVITTHFVELMHLHCHELYDVRQLDKVLERLSATHPKLVDDLIPDPLSRQAVLRVFRNLIREGLSVRDAQSILEALSDYAGRTRDPDILTEFVRQRLSRHITRRYADEEGTLHYVDLAPEVETAVLQGLQAQEGAAPTLSIDPRLAGALIQQAQRLTEEYAGAAQAVILCPPIARGALRRLLERALPRCAVLSSAELLPSVTLRRVGTVALTPAAGR